MKNYIFIFSILIILFKTGNVLSNNNIFNVNNIEISKKTYKNKENLVNQAFKKGFGELIERLLLEEDYKRLSSTNLTVIKELISYYQIINQEEKDKINEVKVNIFFDKGKMHDFFYKQNILYSDIINTEIIFFPLLVNKNQFFIYSKNFFYENWNSKNSQSLIEYNLPVESIENIKKIEDNKNDIYKLNVSNFFEEYNNSKMIFAIIEIEQNEAKVFLNSKISGKKLNKTLSIKFDGSNQVLSYNKVIIEIKKTIRDLIKSQNLIDVRTPSFLNVKIKLNDKSNLVEFKNRTKDIGLINNYYIQQLNKDYALVKIKYLGKITKIIKKLKDQNINLKFINGLWELNII
jgi:hypothetical protein